VNTHNDKDGKLLDKLSHRWPLQHICSLLCSAILPEVENSVVGLLSEGEHFVYWLEMGLEDSIIRLLKTEQTSRS